MNDKPQKSAVFGAPTGLSKISGSSDGERLAPWSPGASEAIAQARRMQQPTAAQRQAETLAAGRAGATHPPSQPTRGPETARRAPMWGLTPEFLRLSSLIECFRGFIAGRFRRTEGSGERPAAGASMIEKTPASRGGVRDAAGAGR